MKQVFFVILFCLLFTSFALPQDKSGEIQSLNQQISTLYQQGKLDEAIPLAEQIVRIQREQKSSNPQNLITSLENLAQIKLTRFKQALTELAAPDINPNTIKGLTEKIQKEGKEIENIFRESLSLAENNGKILPEQIIGIKNNLAWLIYNYFPPDVNLPVGFDKQSKDKFDSLNKSRFYKRINEAELLYTEAVKNSENAFGAENEITLLSIYNLAEFQLAMGNFERAIPQYEKCIATVEKKYGKNNQNLLLPFESYLKALIATGQEEPAFEALSRIVQITRKSAQFPKTMLNISLRADKAFVTVNSPSVERLAQENKEKAEMLSRNTILRSGATQEIANVITMSNSTFGKQYYDESTSTRLIRIPVKVVVDESGKVIEAEGLTKDEDYKIAAEKTVKEWKFEPFTVNGKASKLSGYVECLFLAEKFTK